MKKLAVLIATVVCCFQLQARATPMQTFLMSSAYGSMIGAGIGLASLAFTDDPSHKLNVIARGASIGLYAGMAWGAYAAQAPVAMSQEYGAQDVESPVVVALIPSEQGLVLQSSWSVLNF